MKDTLKTDPHPRLPMDGRDVPEFDRIEEYLRALSYATRLEILHELRFPRGIGELRIQAKQVRAGLTADRLMSRQSVEEHLQKLLEIGVVTAREQLRGPREYVVNGPRLYQIMEEFRQVGTIVGAGQAPAGETAELGSARSPQRVEGPHLVVVHGLLEGRTFPLKKADAPDGRGFIVGRKAGIAVSLDYDPFVSLENSEIVVQDDGFALLDLRSSRNGTWLNWRRLDPDERAALRTGDVLGFGRSLLVFRER